jgi:hypothetical protein
MAADASKERTTMFYRTLVIALALALSTAPARAEDDAASPEPSAAPSASASAEPAPASPSPAAASANDAKELLGSYAYDIDYVLEQQAQYAKFTETQKKQAHDKAYADSPKLELVIDAGHVKISENGVVKTDATYTVQKKNGHVYTLAMETKDKKTDVVNFELTGSRLRMAKEGESEALVWAKK